MIKVVSVLLFLFLAPLIGALIEGLDRKITARMQGRVGPPLLQPFYDVVKLWHKETRSVNPLQRFFIIAYWVILLATGALFFYGGDLLLVIFLLTLAGTFSVLQAYAANSPYSHIGAQRELSAMLAFEPILLLVAVGFYLSNGNFEVASLIQASQPAIVVMPGLFVTMGWVMLIETHKSPFDISSGHHMHSELVSGLRTELTGRMLMLDNLASWYKTVLLLSITALFFIHAAAWSWLLALAVLVLFYFVMILVDNTSPRVRWETQLKSFWIVALALGAVNVLILMAIGGRV